MSNIRLDSGSPVYSGQTLTFKSPADCSAVTGLIVYYPENGSTVSKTFQFADAHGNNVGSVSLFAENVLVKVILDTELSRAYVQNADTNAYLESKFNSKAPVEFFDSYYSGVSSKEELDSILDNVLSTLPVRAMKFIVVSGPIEIPLGGGVHALTIQRLYSDCAVVTAETYAGIGRYRKRTKKNGVWNEWEWINPPLLPNIEYQTIERYNEEPVFVKLGSDGIVKKYLRDGTDITLKSIGASESGHTHDDRYFTETEINSKLKDKADSNHKHSASDVGALPSSGGNITGKLTLGGMLVLTEGVHYGSTLPAAGNKGRIFFKKVSS